MTTEFGCADCYGGDPVAALQYYLQKLTTVRGIVSDNHESVALRECPGCGQQFVTIFTEYINWAADGDDQYYEIVPITPAEAAEVVQAGQDISNAYLRSLGEGRRHLYDYKPAGRDRQILWRS